MLTKSIVVIQVFIGLLVTVSMHSRANDNIIVEIKNCQSRHKQDEKSYLRCLDAADNQFAREISTWENSIIFKLEEASEANGRGEAIAGFKKSIKQFQHFRKVNCQWQYLAFLPDVMMASARLKECEVDMSKDRISKLMKMSELEYY